MRLIFLIFLLSCSQLPSIGEKVPEREVYGYWHESVPLLKEPGSNIKSGTILKRNEQALVQYVADKYVFLKTQKGSGWVKEDYLCSPPKTRTSRDELRQWSKMRHRCPNKRTLEDKSFFSGKFKTDKDELITTFHQGSVIYELNIKDPKCTKFERGRLIIKGDSAYSTNITLNFTDDYIDVNFGPNSDCPNFSKDFYYRLKSCVTKHTLKMFYKLKSSVRDDDAIALSQLLSYPIFTKVRDKVEEIKSSGHFVKLYPRIKNACFKRSIANLRLTDLVCNTTGVMWSDENILLGKKFYQIPLCQQN